LEQNTIILIDVIDPVKYKMSKKELTKDTLDYLSKLALIELTEEEKEEFILELENILMYFKKINNLNTDDVEPTRHPIDDLNNVFREDVARKSLSNEEALKNAKYSKDGYFKAPKVLKNKD
jgi:aspartyl-tRNA(Asn)/glutamyl-tRNA(Gln) amidotransferase subunit C